MGKRDKKERFQRQIRNAGVLFILTGLLFLAISVAHFLFLTSSMEFTQVEDSDQWKRFVEFWMPITGGVLFVSGIIVVSKFVSDDSINS